MCDYSLQNVRTRPAKVGDKLITSEFLHSLTRGFASPEDLSVAVCVLPGTELSFSRNVRQSGIWLWYKKAIKHTTAIFRQVNQANPRAHHDALEFPDGEIVLLTQLEAGQEAAVLQLPMTAVGSKAPQRAAYV
jgi:hypothetical protein